MIEFSQVTKQFYSLTALSDVSLSIPEGETVGLLGPNGAGKTTLIRLIAGFIAPTRGEMHTTLPGEAWPSMGYKPERLQFPPDLQVSQYLELVAGLCNIDKREIDNAILESLARVNLLSAANKQIKTLSKGMRQRMGLAQALIGDPSLLLLDEPSSGLDPAGQEEMLTYVDELRLAGKTVVMSSHLLHEITNVCTYLVILKEGRVLYQNRMSEALTLQPHVAIQVDRDLSLIAPMLQLIHGDVSIEGTTAILRNEAITLRRQILAMLISQGFDILRVEQKRVTLAEIYAEAVQ